MGDSIEQQSEKPSSGLKQVVLDGLVLLKIIKHCKENLPTLVTGQLLGIDFDDRLEVSNSFAFPIQKEESEADVGADYQIEMLRLLREVNVDINTVGWYQSTYLGSFVSDSLVETQFSYQENIPQSVCIVYDPLRTAQGQLALRAVRLTNAFMDLYRNKESNSFNTLKKQLKYDDIFETIPVSVKNPHLVTALLYDLDTTESTANEFDRLDLSTNPFLEKHLEFLSESIDDLMVEQGKMLNYHRMVQRQLQQQQLLTQKKKSGATEEDLSQHAAFKPIPQPSRLDALLITSQIQAYAEQVRRFSGGALNKLFMLEGLQEASSAAAAPTQ